VSPIIRGRLTFKGVAPLSKDMGVSTAIADELACSEQVSGPWYASFSRVRSEAALFSTTFPVPNEVKSTVMAAKGAR